MQLKAMQQAQPLSAGWAGFWFLKSWLSQVRERFESARVREAVRRGLWPKVLWGFGQVVILAGRICEFVWHSAAVLGFLLAS
jgi:hypothetical protein